ncbi:MAG TPA: dynamin family protein [Candidatus Bathyarchaeia archaeon]|nr:dynamin family protein [Candidatus Bathyarchaeia archaeon]
MKVQEIDKIERELLARADAYEQAAHTFVRDQDHTNADKLRQVADKLRNQELNIAFCGHFSAGKSTMLNTLLGVDLLPSNPIPTSANVVKLRGGEKAARVYTKNSGVITFDPDTQMDDLKKYAIDGDTVEWVEVSYPGTFLDVKTSLLDTPGIDSTDAAHKIATESALHLADCVIYMMDYNHVQAEENFNFTKVLKDRGKPVYLVINMIDKHIDFELDFDSYKESVEDAFATWNINPDGIFYTSLAEPDHPENQYEAFRSKLIELMQHRESLISESAAHSAQFLVEEHIRFLKATNSEARREAEEKLAVELEGVESEDWEAVQAAIASTQKLWEEATSGAAHAREEMAKQLNSLLDNARLTYYTTNEAAEAYLESRKPGFKVGFLFAGKKTEEERKQRLQALLADFQEKVSANLDFHFKELLTRLPQEYGIRDEAYHAQVHAFSIDVTAEFLASHVKEGAIGREYVMNYCQDISNGIKAEYRRAGLGFIDQICEQLRQRGKNEEAALQQRLTVLQEVAAAHEKLHQMEKEEKEKADQLRLMIKEGETAK